MFPHALRPIFTPFQLKKQGQNTYKYAILGQFSFLYQKSHPFDPKKFEKI